MSSAGNPAPFDLVVREVRLTFHALKACADLLHGAGDRLGAGHRGVLESLETGGSQTVPALARARPVSRQHIQILVNRLKALGLVEMEENPAHRRSLLVVLTPAGRRRFQAMRRRERGAFPEAKLGVSAARLREAAATLRDLRAALARGENDRGGA